MNTSKKLSYLAVLIGSILLTGCGDAETNIVEQDPIVGEDDDDHDHSDDEYAIESLGRLSVLDADSNALAIYDLDDGDLLDSFSATYSGSALSSSAGYRYAVLASRSNDLVEFVDGGLWQEDHVEHLHDYAQAPAMSDFILTGSLPTHVVTHDGQMAVFFDGDAESSQVSSVTVLSDTNIAAQSDTLPTLTFDVNMHGVAKPVDDMLISTFRRDDSETISANPILPDSIAIYHLHDGEYEQEQLFAGECPDLHGSAVNDDYAVFGCSDGVLALHAHDEEYESAKIANTDDLVADARIGTVYAHHDTDTFFGIATVYGESGAIIMAIDPSHGEMEAVDWEPETDATPVSYGFSYDGEHFLILDDQGYLSVLTAHAHDDHDHWELTSRVDISDEDLSFMPEGVSFSMAISQNGHFAYVADPIAGHVLTIDLDDAEVIGDIELGITPAAISWLGIPEAH
ncbi:5-methyltetrahydrofolate--homocysteine methyltransferase [Alteromonas sp. C1M14]|uniref:5-methyltetrahydrofolate--homocysteine methyltransferase n=1 Tax=Alteromonas sp. C1M14 TaxID=2841567 RepID=UPI001C08DD8C|nr:5-methyltetrahydrofolate--homocysteine methyltransferase [Alteromonas sp. C1M14]MBU2978138.1 5-methyltetrahydrofolate--homocysteine methyltransferase [Alteromonas sp. C1M14]